MKLKIDVDMVKFLNSVKGCKSEVWFETIEGDSLNLKSVLSQYLFSLVDQDDDILKNGKLVCDEMDYELLKEYLA